MKTLFTFLLIIILSSSLWAQHYSFTQAQGTYADLNNDVLLMDDTLHSLAGFVSKTQFRAFGQDLNDTIYVGANGFITSYGPYVSMALDPLVNRFYFPESDSKISYAIDGLDGEKILKVQWKNMGIASKPNDRVNFQVWLYEKDQTIEFRYGACSSVEDFTTGIFLFDIDFTVTKSRVMLSEAPSTPEVNSLNSSLLNGAPENGTIYRFISKTLGIHKIALNTLSVYPNPSSGTFSIGQEDIKSIKAFDAMGREIELNREGSVYRIKNSFSGVLSIRVENKEGQLLTGRLIIK